MGKRLIAPVAIAVTGVGLGGFVLQPVSATVSPTVVVASPAGSGSACTWTVPCNLTEAQLVARRHIANMQSDVDVELQGGTYELDTPLVLGVDDSGKNDHRVSYQAAPGAQPVLSGGRTITGWKAVNGNPGVWVASIPAGFDTRQLYVDGQRLPQASGLPASTEFVQTRDGFEVSSTALDGWPDPTGIAVVFNPGNGPWTQTSCNIASISGNAITMQQPCWGNLHMPSEGVQEAGWLVNPDGGMPGLSPTATPTVLQNAYPLLSPGTWTIDRNTAQIFYMPTAGHNPNSQAVVAPALQTLLQISGTLTRPVSNITVSGLQFSYGAWTGPDSVNGFPQMQADWYLSGPNASATEGTCNYATPPGTCPFASWTRTPANVVLTATHDVTVSKDTFSHLGGAGLDVYYGSQNDVVEGNEFTDVAANAIQLGATDDPLPSDTGAGPVPGSGAREVTYGNVIADNYIHDVADQYLGGVGIWLGYTSHTLVTHNQIDDVPYTAISIGWGGWHTTVLAPGNDPNVNSTNAITDNLLFNYMTDLGDGGAIYTNGGQANGWSDALRLTGNVAYLGPNTDFTYYTDTGSQYVDVNNDVDYYQPFDSFESGGCHTVGHIQIENDFFANGGPAYPCFPYTDVTTSGDTTVCEDPPPAQLIPAAEPILAGAGLEATYRSLLDRSGPSVRLAGPKNANSAGDQVLISGSGFDPGSTVSFGGTPATKVQVLSGNYILATAPPMSGTVDVRVTTPSGTSATSTLDQVTFEANPPACTDYSGSGYSTKNF